MCFPVGPVLPVLPVKPVGPALPVPPTFPVGAAASAKDRAAAKAESAAATRAQKAKAKAAAAATRGAGAAVLKVGKENLPPGRRDLERNACAFLTSFSQYSVDHPALKDKTARNIRRQVERLVKDVSTALEKDADVDDAKVTELVRLRKGAFRSY